MQNPVTVTVVPGDGIGPEIMQATLQVLSAAGAQINTEPVTMGEACYKAGHSSGIPPEAWESIRRNKVVLKGPITTPQGGGFKSLNVTMRKALGLYANVRPCISYAPFISTRHPEMNLVIVRENEEDLYAGIEHRQTDDVFQCLKLITRPGCERIVRHAFEYAVGHGRKKITCMTKDNIMKMTDGLFHQVFDEVAAEYPQIHTEHMIIDIGAARLATRPELFDVIVTPNLYGDILSDIAAELTGSVGLAPSANLGTQVAMFEAIHGSAPDLAGKGVANPSGLLLAAVMMLRHLGQHEVAQRIHNAWLSTLEAGLLTADLHNPQSGRKPLGTLDFAHAVIEHLGQEPRQIAPVRYSGHDVQRVKPQVKPSSPVVVRKPAAHKALVGVDVFVHARDCNAEFLAGQLCALMPAAFELQMITNRGVKVWPQGFSETQCTDHWRCRLVAKPKGTQASADNGSATVTHRDIIEVLGVLTDRGIDVIKTENLCTFDGELGYAMGQGQ